MKRIIMALAVVLLISGSAVMGNLTQEQMDKAVLDVWAESWLSNLERATLENQFGNDYHKFLADLRGAKNRGDLDFLIDLYAGLTGKDAAAAKAHVLAKFGQPTSVTPAVAPAPASADLEEEPPFAPPAYSEVPTPAAAPAKPPVPTTRPTWLDAKLAGQQTSAPASAAQAPTPPARPPRPSQELLSAQETSAAPTAPVGLALPPAFVQRTPAATPAAAPIAANNTDVILDQIIAHAGTNPALGKLKSYASQMKTTPSLIRIVLHTPAVNAAIAAAGDAGMTKLFNELQRLNPKK